MVVIGSFPVVVALVPFWIVVTGSSIELETDCNPSPAHSSIPHTPFNSTAFHFRTELLTKDECIDLALMIKRTDNPVPYTYSCSPVTYISLCDELEGNRFYHSSPISKTYLNLDCGEEHRSTMVEVSVNISRFSPNRAVTLQLGERNDTSDLVQSDVIEPIRRAIVELKVTCSTPATTSKVYEAGILPHMLRFELRYCSNLDVKKRDFSRMPQVKMINFHSSTIGTMEPHTFTDLPQLQNLGLESDICFQLYRIETEKPMPKSIRDYAKYLSDADIERVRRLHCDCAFAWLRNFLKTTPHLVADRHVAELYVVGNYVSPYAYFLSDIHSPMLSVDCAKSLTYNNTQAGAQFAYNTTCHNLNC